MSYEYSFFLSDGYSWDISSAGTDDFSVTDDFSANDDFSVTDDFSATDDFSTDDFSATDDFSVTDDFSTDDFSVTDDFSTGAFSVTDDFYSVDDHFSVTDDYSESDFSVTDDFSGSDFSNEYSVSVTPTLSPTAMPSLVPSSSPSLVPSSSPTVSPSNSPSFNPTSIYDTLEANERTASCYADCSYPGMTVQPEDWTEEEYCAFYQQSTTCSETSVASYSCVPSCLSDCSDVFCDSMSTLVFACDDSVHATYKNKSAVQKSCLNSSSTNSPTRTQMSFTSLAEFGNVSPSEMNTTAGREAAIAAMTMAMPGVTADQVTIESITGSESRRRLSSNKVVQSHMRNGVVVQAVSSNVLYKISVILELLGYTSSSSTAAYDQLVGEISSSVSSGQFQQNLKAAGQQVGVTTFQSADVSKTPAYSSPELTPLVTASPTPAPSSSPTAPEKKSSNGSDDDGDVGAIAGSVIGGFVFLLLIFCFVYFCLNRQRRAKLEEKFKKYQSSQPNESLSLRFDSPSSDQPGAYEEKTSESQSGGGKLGGKAAEHSPAFTNEESDTNNFL